MPRVKETFQHSRVVKPSRKGGFIAYERIFEYPETRGMRGHTTIKLSPKGVAAFKALPEDKRRLFALDLTGGGGYNTEHGVELHIGFDENEPVYKKWRKIQGVLNEGLAAATPNATRSEYRKWQKGHFNLMTPDVIGLNAKGTHIVEISHGTGIYGHPDLFGVTKLKKVGVGQFKSNPVGNKLFRDRAEAEKYAKKVLRGIY